MAEAFRQIGVSEVTCYRWRQEFSSLKTDQVKRRRGPVSGRAPSIAIMSSRTTSSRTHHDGRKYRMLNVVDEFTQECLAIRINRALKAVDVIDVLSDLFMLRGVPSHIRSDNGPEFVAKARNGSHRLAQRPPTSNGAAPGRTVMSKVSMRACETSCSMARSSTRCAKLKS
jgi:hypothetical protein